jgi:hypothetical protein
MALACLVPAYRGRRWLLMNAAFNMDVIDISDDLDSHLIA